MEEVFKILEDYPDYAFSNHGRMLNTKRGKFLKNHKDNFQLSKDNKQIQIALSKLTQKYFSEPIILLSKDEYFEEIPDFPNYKISTYGRVCNNDTGDFLSQHIGATGYYQVDLYKNSKRKKFKIHRLVGKVFIYNDDPINKLEIDHIDRNPLNNHISNLRWVTKSENNCNRLQIREYPKHIYKRKINNYEYWIIQIYQHNFTFRPVYQRCDKCTLEEVKKIRNKIYKENNIIALD